MNACTHYVDNAGVDRDGTLEHPWNNIAGHVNDLSAGDAMCVRGDPLPGRIYTEEDIVIDGGAGASSGTAVDPITIRTFPGEYVILRNTHAGGWPTMITFEDVSHWQLQDFVLDFEDDGGYLIEIITATVYWTVKSNARTGRQTDKWRET